MDAELASIYLKGIKEEPLDAVGEFLDFALTSMASLAWMEAAIDARSNRELSFLGMSHDDADDMAALLEKAGPIYPSCVNTSVGRRMAGRGGAIVIRWIEFLENLC